MVVLCSCVISVISIDVFFDIFSGPKWVVFDSLLTIILSFFIFKSKKIKVGSLGLLTCALTFYMFLSSLWAPNVFEAVSFSLRFACFSLAIFIISSSFNKDEVLKILVDGVFYSSIVFCSVLIFERYIVGKAYSVTDFSPIGFINYLGQVLNVWIPILILSIYMHRNSKVRLIAGVLSTAILMNLLLESGTRGAILGLLCAEVCILLVLLVKTKKFPVKYMAVSAGLLVSVGTFTMLKDLGPEMLQGHVNSIKNLETGRETVFANTADMIVDNPHGVGAGNFQYIHPKYAKMGTEQTSPYLSEYGILVSPYNIILKFYSELGVLFGSVFLIVLSSVFYISFKNFLFGNYVDTWVFMAVFSLCFHAMFSSVFLTPVSLLFSMLLFSVVLSRAKYSVKKLIVKRSVFIVLSIGLALSILFIRSAEVGSNYLANLGLKIGDTQMVERAIEINGYNHRALLGASFLYLHKEQDLKATLNSLENTLEVYPYMLFSMVQAAEISYKLGDFERFKRYKNKVLEIYPANERVLSIGKDEGVE
ncbi:hypothetical protein A7985_10905 [Pseudoalteromonas luteoviolacea]|uniref:Virulence factor membrane-bound polymerase C-terminal domain-containing protein n=2 Tax=Pseudoalteromonas luteoviolacea TaxID=43657 RepID=A0A1C0TQI1_9GAMM|nr:hypothetical protein A7985_10905 [Pseudoalteromonas luteoviolacea]